MLFNTISGVWNNPKIIGRCVMLTGGFVMEKLSNTRAIIFGGTELDAGSAAAVGSVYILDISILLKQLNKVVCVFSLKGLNFCKSTKKFLWILIFTNFTIWPFCTTFIFLQI